MSPIHNGSARVGAEYESRHAPQNSAEERP